ncbi:MAG: hypothetical protein ACR2P8_09230, partial [Myxococcota bacterium]
MSEPASRSVPELLAEFLRPIFLVRLALAYIGVAALLMVSEPVLGAVIARAARNAILLGSVAPYLDTLTWSGEKFRATTHLMGGHLSIDPQGYWFLIAFPAGFAAALPGLLSLRGLGRLLIAVAVSLVVASLLLAITFDGLMAEKFEEVHVRVNPHWRDMLVRSAMRRFWDFAALIYPFAACLALAWTEFGRGPEDASALHWSTALGLLSIALILLAVDRLATARHVDSELALRPHLIELNPYLGRYL